MLTTAALADQTRQKRRLITDGRFSGPPGSRDRPCLPRRRKAARSRSSSGDREVDICKLLVPDEEAADFMEAARAAEPGDGSDATQACLFGPRAPY